MFSVVLCTEAVHSHKHSLMSSSYSSLDRVLSHWDHFTVRGFTFVYLCVFFVFLCFCVILHSYYIIMIAVGWT